MRFDGAPRHFELARNLGVVVTLQQQIRDLLFSRSQQIGLLLHVISPAEVSRPKLHAQAGNF